MTRSISRPPDSGQAAPCVCDFCGGAHPLHLYILGYAVCEACERSILTAKVGDKTYRRIRQMVSDTLAAAKKERAKR